MRKIVRGIINGETYYLKDLELEGKIINRVWTILDEKGMLTKYNTETGEPYSVDLENATLRHWYTVFVEDSMHDYSVREDKFRLHAHSSDNGEVVDLLIEVAD